MVAVAVVEVESEVTGSGADSSVAVRSCWAGSHAAVTDTDQMSWALTSNGALSVLVQVGSLVAVNAVCLVETVQAVG